MSNADIALERGLTLNRDTNTYEDGYGNEYRNEDGECLVGEALVDNCAIGGSPAYEPSPAPGVC